MMREKAVLLTPDDFRFKDSVPDFLQSQVKICEGQMFNVFPLLRLFLASQKLSQRSLAL